MTMFDKPVTDLLADKMARIEKDSAMIFFWLKKALEYEGQELKAMCIDSACQWSIAYIFSVKALSLFKRLGGI